MPCLLDSGPVSREENVDVLLEAVRRVFPVHLHPGTRIMDPGSRNLASASQNQNPETQIPKLEPEAETLIWKTWNPELVEAVRRIFAIHLYPGSGFRDPGFRIWVLEYGHRNPASRIPDLRSVFAVHLHPGSGFPGSSLSGDTTPCRMAGVT